jgi:hypothetical protein
LNEESNVKVDARACYGHTGDALSSYTLSETKVSKRSIANYIMELSSSLSVMKKAVVIQNLATQLQKKQVKIAM